MTENDFHRLFEGVPTMSDELRAAADRVRRVKTSESIASVYERDNITASDGWTTFVHPESIAEYLSDESLIVNAYLAEHPADGHT